MFNNSIIEDIIKSIEQISMSFMMISSNLKKYNSGNNSNLFQNNTNKVNASLSSKTCDNYIIKFKKNNNIEDCDLTLGGKVALRKEENELQKGSLSLRKDGRWMGRYYFEGKQKCVYAKTEKKCRALLKEKLKEINEFSKEEKNKSVIGAQMSLNAWWDEYIEKYKNVKESSKIIYKNNYDANIRNAFLGEKNISKITVLDIQNFINSLETYNRKKVSLKLLKELFDKAHKCGYLKKNVVELAEIKLKKSVDPNKKLNDDAKKVYTAEELKNIFKLLKTKNRMKYYFICKLALYTGCRVGEILALTWNDVKYDEGVIYITKQINQVTKNISDPKSPSSIRKVIIIEPLKKLLDELKDYYNPVNNQEYLVPDAPKANISSIISQLFNRLKINGTIHMFRHTFTSLLKANNIDDKCVQSLLGHESLSTTQDIYQHLTEDNAKKEFEKINKITFEFDN